MDRYLNQSQTFLSDGLEVARKRAVQRSGSASLIRLRDAGLRFDERRGAHVVDRKSVVDQPEYSLRNPRQSSRDRVVERERRTRILSGLEAARHFQPRRVARFDLVA